MANNKTFTVKVKFTFEGEFKVQAEDSQQARLFVEEHCGLVEGAPVSTLPYDEVNWEFPVHPDKQIISVKS